MPSAPFVAVRTDVMKDERVDVVADVGGYSRYEALGRLIALWIWCTDRRLLDAPEDCPGFAVSEGVVRRFLGARGVEALLGAECDELALGARRDDGSIYLRGTSGTVGKLRAHARAAGLASNTSIPKNARAPFVAVRTDIMKDERVRVVADLGGYNRYEALGRLVTQWMWCIDRRLQDAPADCAGYAVSRSVVLRFFGMRGVEALTGGGCDELALGILREDGRIYLRGTSEAVGKFRAHAATAKAGGRAANASTPKNAKGRFSIRTTTVEPPTTPATNEGEPALARANEPTAQTTDARVPTRARQIAAGFWRELAAMREKIKRELDIEAPALPAGGDRGEAALVSRLRHGDEQQVIAEAHHVLAVLAAEARAKRTVQWLTGRAFEDASWRCLIGKSVQDAATPPKAPRARHEESVMDVMLDRIAMLEAQERAGIPDDGGWGI